MSLYGGIIYPIQGALKRISNFFSRYQLQLFVVGLVTWSTKKMHTHHRILEAIETFEAHLARGSDQHMKEARTGS